MMIEAGPFAELRIKGAQDERAAIVAWLRKCADAFAGVPLELKDTGLSEAEARVYSLDAILRYQTAAEAIERGDHLTPEQVCRAIEKGDT